MELDIFNKKFESFKKFEKDLPGVELGLYALSCLNYFINNNPAKLSDNKILVRYYDFESKSIKELFLIDLNLKLYESYRCNICSTRKIYNTKLYSDLEIAYDEIYSKYQYKYYDVYNKYCLIDKFIHGLRKNFLKNSSKLSNDCYLFDFNEVFNNYDQTYFDPKISYEEFYLFLFRFVSVLEKLNIVESKEIEIKGTDFKEPFFKFNSKYQEELINLMFFSFDLMILGNNNVYDVYDLTKDDVEDKLNRIYQNYTKGTDEYKFYINDLLISMVISSSVSQICGAQSFNNIFFEALISK